MFPGWGGTQSDLLRGYGIPFGDLSSGSRWQRWLPVVVSVKSTKWECDRVCFATPMKGWGLTRCAPGQPQPQLITTPMRMGSEEGSDLCVHRLQPGEEEAQNGRDGLD